MKQEIKAIWQRVSPNTLATALSIRSRRNIEKSCIRDGRFELAKRLAATIGQKVMLGPFAGMTLNPSLFPQHMCPKLIGSYEDELHPFFFAAGELNVDHVINIGSAEGYYSVGSCLLWENAFVDAFELDRKSQRVTAEHGRLNGVSDRLRINGRATPEKIEELLRTARLPVIISDCEGFEVELLDPCRAPSLGRSIIICELHPDNVAGIEEILVSRLDTSHTLQVITPRNKSPAEYEEQFTSLDLSQVEQEIAIDEYRGFTPWLVAMPLSYAAGNDQ